VSFFVSGGIAANRWKMGEGGGGVSEVSPYILSNE
jgi:hypothetical protein